MDYKGWSVESEYLEEKERLLLDMCIWMVEMKSSIRDTAKNWGIKKSSFHFRIHDELRVLSPDLYVSVKRRLAINLKYRSRGRSE